jgi:hypothetical protein
MNAATPVRSSFVESCRRAAGGGLLALVGLAFVGVVIGGWGLRDLAGTAGSATGLAALAPYAVGLAVVHGLIAQWAIASPRTGRRFAMRFAIGASVIAGVAALAIDMGLSPFRGAQLASEVAWDVMAILVAASLVYATAAALLARAVRD